MTIHRLPLVLTIAILPGVIHASPGSTDSLRARVIHELELDGVSLKDSPHQLVLRARSNGVVAVILDRQGQELARRTVDPLPGETEAAVAHLSIVVDGMLKRIPDEVQFAPTPTGESVQREGETETPDAAADRQSPADDGFRSRSFAALSIGRGIGASLAGGATEVEMSPVSCCAGIAGETARLELGYWRSRLTAFSIVARVTRSRANLGDSNYAPAVALRAYRAPSRWAENLHLFAHAGWGSVRHDVEIEADPQGSGEKQIDYHDSGPLLLGTGVRLTTSRRRPVQGYLEGEQTLALAGEPFAIVHLAYIVGLSAHLP